MRHWTRTLLVALAVVAGLVYATTFAQDKARSNASKEEQAIRTATADYAAAFNRGDLDTVLAFWAPDAEYIDDAGKSIRGRNALIGMFKNAIRETKGGQLQVKTTAIHFVKPDVAMQDGEVTMIQPNGQPESSTFTAAWINKDGKWLLNFVREAPAEAASAKDVGLDQVHALSWLVGDWTSEEKGFKTTISAHWMKGEHFLKLDYVVTSGAEERLSLTQIIGWDPVQQKLRSWVFDSPGGFGEGMWSREGNTWSVDLAGVTSYGLHGSGTSKWTFVDDDTFTYHALDRTIDDQPMPDVNITYRRVKNAK